MEVHVPSGRPHSWKNFAIELATITAGVLIALSLEALVERHHYRVLVDEARETITSEIKDNEQEMQRVLPKFAASKAHAESALQLAEELLATRKSNINEFSLTVELAELSSASWQTAERTGALSHMPYAEVQKYSRVYSMQELYSDHQRQSLARLASALSLTGAVGDPHKARPDDLRAFRTHVLDLQASLYLGEKFAEELLKSYQKLLSGR